MNKGTEQELTTDLCKLKGLFLRAVTSPPPPQHLAMDEEIRLLSMAAGRGLLLNAALATSWDIRR